MKKLWIMLALLFAAAPALTGCRVEGELGDDDADLSVDVDD
jgi:hypothetical protein